MSFWHKIFALLILALWSVAVTMAFVGTVKHWPPWRESSFQNEQAITAFPYPPMPLEIKSLGTGVINLGQPDVKCSETMYFYPKSTARQWRVRCETGKRPVIERNVKDDEWVIDEPGQWIKPGKGTQVLKDYGDGRLEWVKMK